MSRVLVRGVMLTLDASRAIASEDSAVNMMLQRDKVKDRGAAGLNLLVLQTVGRSHARFLVEPVARLKR